MSRVFLAGFRAGNKRYEHSVEMRSGEAYVHEAETGQRIYNTNEGTWVYNRHGNLAGRFAKTDSGCWYFKNIDGSTRVNTKFTDRLEAERDVFTTLLMFGIKE